MSLPSDHTHRPEPGRYAHSNFPPSDAIPRERPTLNELLDELQTEAEILAQTRHAALHYSMREPGERQRLELAHSAAHVRVTRARERIIDHFNFRREG